MESSGRELLQRALDALEGLRDPWVDARSREKAPTCVETDEADKVIAAIRTRLGKPEAADESERLREVKAAAQALIDYEDAGPDDGRGGWLHWEEKFDALRSVLK